MIPVLRYPDPGVAAEWLSKAFGFTVRLRIANHRIQMRAGEGCFTISESDAVPNQSVIAGAYRGRVESLRAIAGSGRQDTYAADGSSIW